MLSERQENFREKKKYRQRGREGISVQAVLHSLCVTQSLYYSSSRDVIREKINTRPPNQAVKERGKAELKMMLKW